MGTVVTADDLVGGRAPSYELGVDLGSRGSRSISLQAGALYRDRDALVGCQVVCALDDGEDRILFAESHSKGVVLLRPDVDVEPGTVIGSC